MCHILGAKNVAYPRRIVVVVVIVVIRPLEVVDTLLPGGPTRCPPRSDGRRTRDATGAVPDPCYCPGAASRAVPRCRGCSILYPHRLLICEGIVVFVRSAWVLQSGGKSEVPAVLSRQGGKSTTPCI